jgi:hypothetical protein
VSIKNFAVWSRDYALTLEISYSIYRSGKKSWPSAILPYGKDSDDLLISVNIIVSLVLNGLFKMFNPIEEDRLNVFECRIFPDLCHGFQPSETIRPLSCARTFRRVRDCRYSDIANQVSGKGIKLCIGVLCSHFATIEIVHVNENDSINIYDKIASSRRENYVKCYQWNTSDCILIGW